MINLTRSRRVDFAEGASLLTDPSGANPGLTFVPEDVDGESSEEEDEDRVYYWLLPDQFLGNKVRVFPSTQRIKKCTFEIFWVFFSNMKK